MSFIAASHLSFFNLAFTPSRLFNTLILSFSLAVCSCFLNIGLGSVLNIIFLTIFTFSPDWSIICFNWDAVTANLFKFSLSRRTELTTKLSLNFFYIFLVNLLKCARNGDICFLFNSSEIANNCGEANFNRVFFL